MREKRGYTRSAELTALNKRAQIEKRILERVLYEALDSEHIITHRDRSENFE